MYDVSRKSAEVVSPTGSGGVQNSLMDPSPKDNSSAPIHGSPHDFDKFDASKIEIGRGAAQAVPGMGSILLKTKGWRSLQEPQAEKDVVDHLPDRMHEISNPADRQSLAKAYECK